MAASSEVYGLDIEIWPSCLVVPTGYRIALSVRGTDYDHGREGARLAHFKNELRGCGPFVHDDPVDRPSERSGGEVTVHTGGGLDSHVLLPVIPT